MKIITKLQNGDKATQAMAFIIIFVAAAIAALLLNQFNVINLSALNK